MPWRLGSEERDQGNGKGPDPLNCVRDPIRPVSGSRNEPFQNSRGNKLANDPAEVNISGQIRPQSDRADFGGISCCQGLKDAPTSGLVSRYYLTG